MCPKCTAKSLLFNAAYDNELGKSLINMNISVHDIKDNLLIRGASSAQTRAASQPTEQIYLEMSLSASQRLNCTVLSGER